MRSTIERRAVRVVLFAVLTLFSTVTALLLPQVAITAGPAPGDFEEACDEGDPYYVTACYLGMTRQSSNRIYDPNAPSIVLFRNTPNNSPRYTLATFNDLGTVWGLAYRSSGSSVYAAAYHKRQLPFGPSGPDAIYRIDLNTGDVAHVIKVPNVGPDRHEQPIRGADRAAGMWASRTGLGDLDIHENEEELAVVNLDDGQIYRFALPTGNLVGSFVHGAAQLPWADEARPFGLAYSGDNLFHGVVRSAEKSNKASDLRAYVYRSWLDGSEMSLVAEIDLDYSRGRLPVFGRMGVVDIDWQPWDDGRREAKLAWSYDVHPMPLLVDIAFDAHDSMIVGLRDRLSDSTPLFLETVGVPQGATGFGVGDVLRGVPSGSRWEFNPRVEFFDDEVSQFGDESALGGLAYVSQIDQVAVGAYAVESRDQNAGWIMAAGALWFDAVSGNKLQLERVCDPQGLRSYRPSVLQVGQANADDGEWSANRGPGTVGDVEVLCGPGVAPTASPTSLATATPTSAPTATATSTATATPTLKPLPTPTQALQPVYLPLALNEECDPTSQQADVVLVIDTSSSMAGTKLADAKDAAIAFVRLMDLAPGLDQVAVVRFDTEAEVVQVLSSDGGQVESAIRQLENRSGTHIDRGLRASLLELQSERRDPVNMPVMVLLTDGIQTGDTGAELGAARDVRDTGIRLYAVGLGGDVDDARLIEMTGDQARYYFAPDSAHLEQIYREVARIIQCPPERYWGQR